jgi:hypothetical protein
MSTAVLAKAQNTTTGFRAIINSCLPSVPVKFQAGRECRIFTALSVPTFDFQDNTGTFNYRSINQS